jgi:hypothetical protein
LLKILDYDFTMFIPTAAQKLDTKVYNHMQASYMFQEVSDREKHNKG